MLLLLGLFNLEEISSFEGGRITAMGGGPIVFSRWRQKVGHQIQTWPT